MSYICGHRKYFNNYVLYLETYSEKASIGLTSSPIVHDKKIKMPCHRYMCLSTNDLWAETRSDGEEKAGETKIRVVDHTVE